jgi:hypothetical protein
MTSLLVAAFLVAPFAAVGSWLRRRDDLRFVLMLTALALTALWLC